MSMNSKYRTKANVNDYVGKKYGKITILRENKTTRQTRVDYKCDCGQLGNVKLSDIICKHRKGGTPRCRQCGIDSMKKGTELINGQYFYQIRHNAELRGIYFDITPQDLHDLWINQKGKCAISGISIQLPVKKKAYKEDGKQTIHYFGNASVDRIDSLKGYKKENIQWVLSKINIMKMETPQDEFIQLCKLIVNHNENENSIIIDQSVVDKFQSTKEPNRRKKLKYKKTEQNG